MVMPGPSPSGRRWGDRAAGVSAPHVAARERCL